MGKKTRPVLHRIIRFTFLGSIIISIFPAFVPLIHLENYLPGGLFVFVSCEAAESSELFTVDVGQQKANLEKEFAKIEDWIPLAKLHEVRNTTDLIEHKVERLRKNLTREETGSYQSRIDKIRKIIAAKEDSLVNITMGILNSQGVDASLQFMQNDLREHGVEESKINAVEKKILEEAPVIKQAQEHDALARTLKILESGNLPDSSIDPYIIKTAERILQARQDSIKRIEDEKKRIEMEEKEKIERARMEKEIKEKERQDELLVKQREEEVKQKRAEEERQKKLAVLQGKERKDSIENELKVQKRKEELAKESEHRIEEARKERENAAHAEEKRLKPLLAQQEKVRQDSIKADKKEKERLAKVEEKRQKEMLAQQEKVRKDSIKAADKDERLARMEEMRQKTLLPQQRKARKDSIEADKKEKERMARMEEHRQNQVRAQQEKDLRDNFEADKKEKERLARLEEQRQKQTVTQQEKARKDSIEADMKEKERQARLEDLRQKQTFAQQEKARKDSIEADKKEKERLARLEDLRQKQTLAQKEKARKDSLEADRKDQERLAKARDEQQKKLIEEQVRAQKDSLIQLGRMRAEKQEVKKEPAPKYAKTGPEVSVQTPKQVPTPSPVITSVQKNPPPVVHEEQKAPAGSAYAQAYLQKLKDSQKDAQKNVMELYKMLGQGQAKEALEKFKQRRDFIAQYIDVEVFNVLEQSIMQSVMESQPPATSAPAPDAVRKKVSPDQEHIDRINGLLRDNKIEAAYAEFKRSEKQLKIAMPKDDFKLLKTEVESSYKTYKSNNK
jgi:hypothetical protein